MIIIEFEVVNNCGKTSGQRLTCPFALIFTREFTVLDRLRAAIRDVRLIRHVRHGARLSQLSANIRKLAYRCARATGKGLLERAVLWTLRWLHPVNSARTDISSYTGSFNDKYPRIRGIIGVQRSRTVRRALKSAAAFHIPG